LLNVYYQYLFITQMLTYSHTFTLHTKDQILFGVSVTPFIKGVTFMYVVSLLHDLLSRNDLDPMTLDDVLVLLLSLAIGFLQTISSN